MQSPLTPQQGRIESNPREYTHMGPRPCGELETMPADWAKGSRARRTSVDNWTLAKREWIFGRTSEDFRKSPKNRPNIHSRYPTVRKSSLVHHSRISRPSFVSNMRDDRKMREKYER